MAARRGYTLVELLVAAGVAGVLLALTAGAVQKARHAAARAACGNNLRNIGLALHSYHDTYRCLPPAVASPGAREPTPYLTWAMRVMPFADQGVTGQQVADDYRVRPDPFLASPPHRLQGRPSALFTCPSGPSATARRLRLRPGPREVALSSYLANPGTSSRSKDGVIYVNSKSRLDQLGDGAAATLLCGERPPSADGRYGWLYVAFGSDGRGSLDTVLGPRENNTVRPSQYSGCGAGPFAFRPGDASDPCSVFHHWSLHPGGANFAFCDGSVRFLPYSADAILPALATRAGGESVQLPD